MENEDKITLRDKIAISLLAGYLNNHGNENDDRIRYALINPDKYAETFTSIQNRIRAAYKMADLIRKIRLETFS